MKVFITKEVLDPYKEVSDYERRRCLRENMGVL